MELIHRRADGQDDVRDAANIRHIIGESQLAVRQDFFQQRLPALFEKRQLALGQGIQRLLADVINQGAEALLGQNDGQGRADVARPSDHDNFVLVVAFVLGFLESAR